MLRWLTLLFAVFMGSPAIRADPPKQGGGPAEPAVDKAKLDELSRLADAGSDKAEDAAFVTFMEEVAREDAASAGLRFEAAKRHPGFPAYEKGLLEVRAKMASVLAKLGKGGTGKDGGSRSEAESRADGELKELWRAFKATHAEVIVAYSKAAPVDASALAKKYASSMAKFGIHDLVVRPDGGWMLSSRPEPRSTAVGGPGGSSGSGVCPDGDKAPPFLGGSTGDDNGTNCGPVGGTEVQHTFYHLAPRAQEFFDGMGALLPYSAENFNAYSSTWNKAWYGEGCRRSLATLSQGSIFIPNGCRKVTVRLSGQFSCFAEARSECDPIVWPGTPKRCYFCRVWAASRIVLLKTNGTFTSGNKLKHMDLVVDKGHHRGPETMKGALLTHEWTFTLPDESGGNYRIDFGTEARTNANVHSRGRVFMQMNVTNVSWAAVP